MNSVEFERVLQKLLMRLVWNLLEYFNIYIHLDVNSDVNSQPFLCNFAGTIGWSYGNCPVNLAEFDWVLQKLLMQSTEPALWQRRRSVFSLISQSILNRFTCNFAHTIRSHCGDCPENLVRFERVFQKLLMWCTETTLFPHRQSAENAGRHWNSTEEVPSLHRTCVTEQLELTRQVARIERVIINTTST